MLAKKSLHCQRGPNPLKRGLFKLRERFNLHLSLGLIGFFLPLLALMAGCTLLPPPGGLNKLSPAPSLISSVTGYLSFRLEREQERLRGRAFFLLAPGQGRLEILDPVGRLAMIAIWRDRKDWLIVPREKVYWEGRREESDLVAQLVGFPLEPVELLAWIVGRTEGLELLTEEGGDASQEAGNETSKKPLVSAANDLADRNILAGWQVERDKQGRLWRGEKGDLKITIIERSQESQVARSISLVHPCASGRLTLLGLDFNRPVAAPSFRLNFLENSGYRAVTWEEMEEILRLNKR